jgi:hypothetical protein
MSGDLPPPVYRLLELLESKPHVRDNDVPPELRDALRVALAEGVVETQTAGPWGQILTHGAYGSLFGRAYWLSERGRDVLARYRVQQADRKQDLPPQGPTPSARPAAGTAAGGAEAEDGERRESLTDNEYTVLQELRNKRPRRVWLEDLATSTRIGRKACGKIITSFIKRGLAERLRKRLGVTITPLGEDLLTAADAAR